jgi:TRAP-type transport system small permease protein
MARSFAAGFDRAAAWVACALLVTLLACVALGVITRGLNNPLIWTDELSRFLMVWLAAFGWVLATRRGIHVRIRFFQDLLPRAAHGSTEVVIQLAIMVLGVLVAWQGAGLVAKNHDLEATTLPLSMSWFYAPLVLAGVVTALQAVHEAIRVLTQARDAKAGKAGAT